jgi:hypothetical protein
MNEQKFLQIAKDVHDIKTSLLLKNNTMKTKICKEIGEDHNMLKFNCGYKNAAKTIFCGRITY